MKKIIPVLLLVLLGVHCQSFSQHASLLNSDAFEATLKDSSVQLLDVRTVEEFKTGYIKGALHADWLQKEEFSRRTGSLDLQRPVAVYCASGGRSAKAAEALRAKGYTVVELAGGLNKWKLDGKAVQTDSPVAQMTMDEFQQFIGKSGVVLVDFGAPWCPPCRKMEPVLAAIEKDMPGKFRLQKIDGGVHTNIMKALNVEALPHFFVYKNGVKTWDKQGIVSADELKKALQ